MPCRWFRRFFHSVFTKLLVIILSAGIAITLAVVVGFCIIRFQGLTDLDRNLVLYAEYLTADLGDPPAFERAATIAQRTGMGIRFDHPDRTWQTTTFPGKLPSERAWTRGRDAGIWTCHVRGRVYVHIKHAGGDLFFSTPHWTADHGNAVIIVLATALTLATVLAAAYFAIREVLKPLRTLKTGVEALGNGQLDHRIPQNGHDEFRDLSDAFNMMARRLSILLKNKEQLLLDVSHELRSPLTRIKVQLELLQDKVTRENLQADVAEIEDMVTTILDEARLRNTSSALQLEPTDMAQLVRSVVDDFQNRLPGVLSGSLDPVTVLVDSGRMRLVVRNLIDNALKNTYEDGGPVRVHVARKENSVDIIVEDWGVGIPKSALQSLFDPFYRPDTSRSRKTGGYGLGLSLCKAVVDAHKGKINITSTLDQGTRVTVTLPNPS
jgi:signal transduction histidine kinase